MKSKEINMKSIITINFKRIGGEKVDKKLLIENPKLSDITRQTLTKLCQTIKRYFNDYKIKVGVSWQLEESG